MITLTFQAPTIEELHAKIAASVHGFSSKNASALRGLDIQDEPKRITEPEQMELDTTETTEVKYSEPKKRGRKKKVEEPVDEERGVDYAKDDKKSYTKEEVYEALQKVNVNVSLMAAREILLSFGVQRMSELKTSQYEAFVKRCEEVLG